MKLTTSEIIRKVKLIEFRSKKRTNALFLGEYHSSYKGTGMTFSEVRTYQFGDDVRKMDWNKTARFNEPFVKVFEEERELSVMLLVDVSSSLDFGTRKQLKKDTIAEICATLGFSAITNNDKVGLILFSDKIHKVVPPKKGKDSILRIISEIVDFETIPSKTDYALAFDFLIKTLKRKSIVFLFSDAYQLEECKELKFVARKHDLNIIRISDEKEQDFPNIGWIQLKDAESNKTQWINTSSEKIRNLVKQNHLKFENYLENLSKKYSFNYRSLKVEDDYIKTLLSIFKVHHK